MFEGIIGFLQWARQHVILAVFVLLGLLLGYGSYQFVGSYAYRFGSSFVGNYQSFKRTVASYTVIDNMLHTYLLKYNVSRIGIARFHNSVRDLGNNSMFFVSFESMTTSPGVSAELQDLQNVPAVTFAPILSKLIDGQSVFIWTKDLQQSTLRELALKRGARAILFVPVRDLSDRLIGMITATWISEGDVPNQAKRDEMSHSLSEAAIRIGAYFSASPEI